MRKSLGLLLLVALVVLLLDAGTANAYIGPGAGVTFTGSFLAVFAAVFSAVLTLLTWPARLLWRSIFGWRAMAKARFQRVVVLGLDGLDHGLTQQMLAEGKLPHLEVLRKQGCFKSLGTTLPSISPVAWSSFQTGTNPGKHNVFDFLTPDLDTYRPKLSSVEIRPPRRTVRIGKYRFPLSKADVRLLRKSRPFWNYLSDQGIFSSIIRVPITFPPEKLRGVLLSAMCVPDLRGTQGMFSYYTTRPEREGERIGGEVHRVVRKGNEIRAELIGPENPYHVDHGILKTPFVVSFQGDRVVLKLDGEKYELRKNEYTDWIRVPFHVAPTVTIHGLCKFLLLDYPSPHSLSQEGRGMANSLGSHEGGRAGGEGLSLASLSPDGRATQGDGEFGLYVTPINIDPESPVMPISSPKVYSKYLTAAQGPFATLGLAEDTWAVNEHVLGDRHFLQQCLDADAEREKMFFDALDKAPTGLCVCVFDGPDRIQHVFWRDIDPTHPARAEHPVPEGRNVIEDLYRSMDDLVGRTMAKLDRKNTLLLVISDHGFNNFRRGLDLNRWLEEAGYLTFHKGRRNEEFLAGVDWSRTRAFAVGLTGLFINRKGKFSQGIVESGEEADKLCEDIAARLTGLIDPDSGLPAIRRAYVTAKVYRGPYKENAPDVIPGYHRGYRVSWETAIGRGTDSVFLDNTKAWSGDHCIDPSLIPGVLFSNYPIHTDNPRLLDVGPTILQLFGVPIPDHVDGKPMDVEGGRTFAAMKKAEKEAVAR